MYAYLEEKIPFSRLSFHNNPPPEETARKPTARKVGQKQQP
jgi:hypothetical protein